MHTTPDNTLLLQHLLHRNQVRINPGAFLTTSPSPLPANFDFGRVEAMLLALAIGDSLGNTTESSLPAVRAARHGEIRHYLPNRHAGGEPAGVPSDDTQMAFWTLEHLLQDGSLAPEKLAQRFSQEQIFWIGSTVKAFLLAYKDQHKPWHQAGQPSAGNGALMRTAPILIPHLLEPSPALWADAVLAGMVTHNDPASHACCVAFTHILWECLCLQKTPEPSWWIDTFSAAASQLEGETAYSTRQSNRPYQGPLWKFVDSEVRQALAENLSVLEACQRWHSGAYLLETMPCVLYILARHAGSLEEALVRAVNDTKDNDTIAAIVGAALGALHGRHAIPERWIEGLLGRLGSADDWHLFALIEEAKQVFWKTNEPISDQNIAEVLALLPLIESPDFQAGNWIIQEGHLPYYTYHPDSDRIRGVLGKNGFVIVFTWPEWVEGRRFSKKPELLQQASLQTLRKLITAHIRTDRFSEGHLASVIESGLMAAILHRLAEIRAG
jgi:ADP-ribosyl-[dinitrogen reductase] hydrolase